MIPIPPTAMMVKKILMNVIFSFKNMADSGMIHTGYVAVNAVVTPALVYLAPVDINSSPINVPKKAAVVRPISFLRSFSNILSLDELFLFIMAGRNKIHIAGAVLASVPIRTSTFCMFSLMSTTAAV